MRKFWGAAALAVAVASAPAEAKVFNIGVSGTVFGTSLVFFDLQPMPRPFSKDIEINNLLLGLNEGLNFFSFGNYEFGGETSFTIDRSGEVLTGVLLSFRQQNFTGLPCNGCSIDSGSTTNFRVTGGVPEPTTWAMMIAGFGAIGGAMRRRKVRGSIAFG